MPRQVKFCPIEELAQHFPEATILSKVSIAGIPKGHQILGSEDAALDRTVIVLSEYIEGESLRDQLRLGKTLDATSTFALLLDVATVLAALHNAEANGSGSRIVHGDLKPANVIIASDGKPHLIDFGIMKELIPGRTHSFTVTRSRFTFGYSPPEQLVGQIIPASDIYALGVTAVECLTGKVPEALQDVIKAGKSFALSHDKDLPKSLVKIINKMLSYSAEDRYQNGQELLDALQTAKRGPQTWLKKLTDPVSATGRFLVSVPTCFKDGRVLGLKREMQVYIDPYGPHLRPFTISLQAVARLLGEDPSRCAFEQSVANKAGVLANHECGSIYTTSGVFHVLKNGEIFFAVREEGQPGQSENDPRQSRFHEAILYDRLYKIGRGRPRLVLGAKWQETGNPDRADILQNLRFESPQWEVLKRKYRVANAFIEDSLLEVYLYSDGTLDFYGYHFPLLW
jgi:hypothetical protein